MADKMSLDLKCEILHGLGGIVRRCITAKTHIERDRHPSVIMDSLKWVKKDTDILLKFAKEEYRKECYGIRKEQNNG